MSKWWSWIPGLHGVALNKCRREALSSITGERLFVERMAQRQRPADEGFDDKLRADVLKKLDEIYAAAQQTNDIDELDDLTGDAELQGLFAAYLCPVAEITIEGDLVLDQIDGWGIPKSSTETARKLWQEASQSLKTSPDQKVQIQEARGALYALFAERDAWQDYLDDHEEKTHRTMWILFVVVIASLIAAVFAVYYAYFVSPLLIFGVLAAGAAGSCASVMSKMPTLENRLSRKPDSYAGGVLARIATGLIGTVIGCALLAWVPLSIGDKSFGTLVSACTTGPSTTANPCSTLTMLILIGIATLLGFSERTLPFFEQRMFGKAGLPPTRSKRRKI
jgi:hypothetical protein